MLAETCVAGMQAATCDIVIWKAFKHAEQESLARCSAHLLCEHE